MPLKTLMCPRADRQPKLHLVQWAMIYLSTALRLGVANVARVVIFRTCKRAGIYRRLLPLRKAVPLELRVDSFHDATQSPVPWTDRSVLREADELLTGRANYFSVHARDIGNPPNWFLNPFQNKRHPQLALHWSKIADFSAEVGDIKVFWEISRFSWASVFARAWRISGDARYLSALHLWMQDWWQCNPPNMGPNWMCGQEISIRLINALLALRMAGLDKNGGSGLVAFVEARIAGALISLRFTLWRRTTIMQRAKLRVFSWVARGWLGMLRGMRDAAAKDGPRKAARCSIAWFVGWSCPMAASRSIRSLTTE